MPDNKRPRALRVESLAATSLILAAAVAQAAPPVITSRLPLGLRPGQEAELVVGGQHLDAVTQLWTSWGMSLPPTAADAGAARFKVALPAEAPLGLQAFRVLSPGGVSDLQLVMIDDLPSVSESAGNNTRETAQALTLPCAVDGVVENLSRDYFQFEAQAGQQISFEVWARRLGSPLDPALFLYRADGKEIAYSDDVEGLSGDAQLCHTFDSPGQYIVEVRDIGYSGGAQHVYRLRAGDFPCLNVPLPMGVRRGQKTRIDFAGLSVNDANPAWADVPADWPHNWYPVATRRPGGSASGFALVAVGDEEEILEREPNDTLPQAEPIALPAHINGRLDVPGDIDRFRISAKAGQRFVFTGVTRGWAAPTDLVLELTDANGKQVARVDDVKTAEGILDHTFAAEGEYLLAVQDLLKRGGSPYAYRVEVEPFQPGFDLSLAADHLDIPAGGVGSITVNVNRREYNGPIHLSAEGLPEGWEALPTQIGPGMTAGELTIRAGAGATTPAVLDQVRIVGTAPAGPDLRATATLTDTLRARWNQLAVIPHSVSTRFAAAAAPAPPFELSVEPAEVVLGPNLKTTVKVVAKRGDQVVEPIELAAILDKLAFPADVALKLQPIPKDANEVALELTAGPKAPLGDFTVVLRGTHKKDKDTLTAVAAPINYRLTPPLTVAVEAGSASMKRGGNLPVKVNIQRNPALSGEIKVVLGKAPAGVTAPELVIPADQSSAELVLSATTEASAGEFADAVIQASVVGSDQFSSSVGLGKIVIE